MVRSFLLTICLLFLGSLAWSQTRLEGKVTDPTGPAFGVTVKVLKGTQLIAGGVTDFDGQYSISLNPGTYDVQFELLGFASRKETGVDVLAGRTNFVNQKFSSDEGVDIAEVVIKAYKAPLIEKDNTSSGKVVTADQIRSMPTRSINTIVATTAGVSSVDGGDVTIRGSRADATNYYVDGVRVSKNSIPRAQDVDQIQVITGGLGAEYGDVTGGVVSLYTKGPAQKITGGLEAETSNYLDPYGYSQVNGNLAGPILRKKSGETLLGFRISGTGTFDKDDDQPAIPVYRITDEKYAELAAKPVQRIGTTVVNSGEFLTNSDVDVLKYRSDEASSRLDLAGKLDLRLNSAIDMSVTGTMQKNKNKFTPDNWEVLNSRNNPTQFTDRFAGIFRFRHRLGGATAEEAKDRKGSVISNAQYMLSFGVEQEKNRRSDPRHGDDLFAYGHVGQFQYRWDSVIGFENGRARHVGNVKNFVGFTPGTQNPILAAYDEFAIEGFEDSYILRNGITPTGYRSIWSGMHSNVGSVFNSNRKQQFDTYTLNATAGFDLTPGGSKNGRHSIQFGLLYEQRAERSYNVAPIGLQNIGDLLANAHITGVDSTKILRRVWVPAIQDSVDIYDTFVGAIEPDSKFYKTVRESLGIAVDDYVNVAGLRPDQLRLDMFSPRELADQELISYYGYDYLGNKLPSTTTFRDFFTQTVDGSRTFPVLARTPVYQAAYIQDKFSFRDIIFRVGLRVDRFDANTKIMKDPYSLYEIMGASEFYSTTGLNKPSNVDDAWKVYVTDGDEKAVTGYRDGDQWYDAKGTAVSDGNVLFGGGVVKPRLKYKNETIKDTGFDPDHSFADYEPEVNWTPRLAFSFPISDDAGFFAHYDILVQRPPGNNNLSPLDYYYFYDNRDTRNLANAALKPERTIDYEVGFQQKLNNNSAIKMSAFYRELRDMVQRRTYLYIPTINTYDTYGNIDFSTVKGFSFTYDLRRVQNAQMQLAYTLQFADGTGTDANSQSGNASRGNLRTLFPLGNDERHNIQASIDYRFDRGKKYNGPRIGGKNILAEAGANLLISAVSGRPYTAKERATRFDGAGTVGALNGNRLPWRMRVDLRLDKNINLSSNEANPLAVTIYMRVTNILNIKNINNVYGASGSPIDDGYFETSNGSSDIQNIIDSGKSLESYYASYQWRVLNPDNYGSPRRIILGATFDF